MLCSKLRCQKGFNIILVLYQIRLDRQPVRTGSCTLTPNTVELIPTLGALRGGPVQDPVLTQPLQSAWVELASVAPSVLHRL